jgi:hypothetical protein
MNYIEFYADSDKVIEAADREFTVVTVLPPSEGGDWEKTKLGVYDARSEEEIRKGLRRIYNRYEPIV